jgi:hypothetical protein
MTVFRRRLAKARRRQAHDKIMAFGRMAPIRRRHVSQPVQAGGHGNFLLACRSS